MGEERKEKPVLADLTSVFSERRWLPRACHLFANVIIIDSRDRKFFLCSSESREEWTPLGGELEYQDMEQFPEGAAREAHEESGALINPKDLILLDSKISYPTKENDPYGGVIPVINSYLYILKPEDPIPSVEKQIPEEGCMTIEIRKFSFPELWEDVRKEKVSLYPNFIETLEKMEEWIKKNL